MTCRTAGQFGCRTNFSFRGKLFADFFLVAGSLPIHVEHLIKRAEDLLGVAVAAQTPLHQERRGLKHERHLVDGAVARGTAHALVHVNAVIEINEIRQPVNPYPLDGFIRAVALANRFQVGGVGIKYRVAIHAGFRRGNAREGGSFDGGMTVAAVKSVVADVVLVAELDGLGARNVLVSRVRRPRQSQNSSESKSGQKNSRKQAESGDKIRTAMKNLSHLSVALWRRPPQEGARAWRLRGVMARKCAPGSSATE